MSKTETAEAWPLPERTPEEVLRWVIKTCAHPARSRNAGRPRWSIVSSVIGHGSGVSAEMCRWAGVDPNERCVRQ